MTGKRLTMRCGRRKKSMFVTQDDAGVEVGNAVMIDGESWEVTRVKFENYIPITFGERPQSPEIQPEAVSPNKKP